MPRAAVLGMTIFLVLSSFVGGHDLPNARIDRSTQVILSAGRLRLIYEVSLAELTLVQDLRQIDGVSFVGSRAELFQRYAQAVGPLNARGFLLTLDGQELDLQFVDSVVRVEGHLQISFQFEAKVPPSGRLRLIDTNYASSEGSARLGLRIEGGVLAQGDLPPPEVSAIPWQPVWQMTDEQERRTKRLELTYDPPASLPPPEPTSTIQPRAVSVRNRFEASLTQLIDRPTGTYPVVWLLTAVLLGAAHALQPGHGKTLVAAATLDGRHGALRGSLLGLITAGIHLLSVTLIAALVWWLEIQQVSLVHLAISHGSGCVIAAVGMFRIGRYSAGIDSHNSHLARIRPDMSLWTLGIAGGIVPCWDAVALVVLASSIGQLGSGLILLAAFSTGLALVLGGVGLVATRLLGRLAHRKISALVNRWLGLVSALILTTIGLSLLAL